MPKLVNRPMAPQTRRRQANQEELAERIAHAVKNDGFVEPQPDFRLYRLSAPSKPVYGLCESALCVIAQGSKVVLLGSERFRYDPAHYLISTVGLPTISQVVEATPESPYLGFRLVLDPSIVTSVLMESGDAQTRGEASVKAIDVSPLDDELLDATLRLARLADSPREYPILAPLVIREIVYRLITGAQGSRMRHMATFGGHAHRMVRAVKSLRENFDKPLRIEDLAREIGMSTSGFHAHFKAVASMSPLQFQKQLRLQEARRLMVSENLDAAEAGYRVGYKDASFFSREYKRHFGEPPVRDVERLRELAATGTAV